VRFADIESKAGDNTSFGGKVNAGDNTCIGRNTSIGG
jgi:UDP-3-O-[3-hydroxymyristoyl] glucosamine N-acyltransferase